MNPATINQTTEAEIESLMDRWLRDVQSMDVDRIMTHYAPDIRAFDAVSELQFKGVDSYGKHWRHCMAQCPGPMVFEIDQVKINAGADIAFAHYLTRCGGVDSETGEERAGWMRGTSCFRKIDGEWRIVHEHFSAPFNMETQAAMFDLQP